jgi:hypothetical protein
VVPSRADDVAHSPGGVVGSLDRIRSQPRVAQAGCSQKFHVLCSWCVQNIPGACRTPSAVLGIEVLLFGERKKKEKEQNKTKYKNWLPNLCGAQCLGFQDYYGVL